MLGEHRFVVRFPVEGGLPRRGVSRLAVHTEQFRAPVERLVERFGSRVASLGDERGVDVDERSLTVGDEHRLPDRVDGAFEQVEGLFAAMALGDVGDEPRLAELIWPECNRPTGEPIPTLAVLALELDRFGLVVERRYRQRRAELLARPNRLAERRHERRRSIVVLVERAVRIKGDDTVVGFGEQLASCRRFEAPERVIDEIQHAEREDSDADRFVAEFGQTLWIRRTDELRDDRQKRHHDERTECPGGLLGPTEQVDEEVQPDSGQRVRQEER